MGTRDLPFTTAGAIRRGIYLGSGSRGPYFAPREHGVLVLGPPRSGKTTSVIIPNVIGASGSVLSVSTKRDVLDATAIRCLERGRCLLFDPSDTVEAPKDVEKIGWSPLASSRSWDDAVMVADSMVGSSGHQGGRESGHWTERAGALLAAIFHGAALEGLSMDQVVRSVNRREPERLVDALARADAVLALDLLVGILETDSREQSGIWSTASGVLSAYRTRHTLDSAGLPSLDAAEFCRVPTTVFVVAPSEHQQQLAPLVAGLLREIRTAAFDGAREPGRGTSPNVLLALDELANIAPLHDLPTLVAEGASQGLLTLASLQDLSQARTRWGAAADGFLSLFGAKLILAGIGDRTTLEAVSLLAGDHDVPVVSVNSSRGHFRRRTASTTQSVRRERRLPPDAIASPPAGAATAIIGATVGRVQLTPVVRTPDLDTAVPSLTRAPAARTVDGREDLAPPARVARSPVAGRRAQREISRERPSSTR